MRERFERWFSGEWDVMDDLLEADEHPDTSREEIKRTVRRINRRVDRSETAQTLLRVENATFRVVYRIVAVVSCVFLIGVLLYTIAGLPRYGLVNPRTTEVVRRYVEEGLKETGALNIVAGMILDYRAFDTLGESHVLFTALVCVTILLRIDRKNMRQGYEDYYTVRTDAYHSIKSETILRYVGMILIPCIFVFGIYVLLNGQNGPGGGFSGGTVMGTGLIIFAAAFGFTRADQVFTAKLLSWTSFLALGFYSFAKGYVFFTGANGMENHIPKGIPGAIISGGLILPLDIAVGLVVACTMYGFYSLFRKGRIGAEEP